MNKEILLVVEAVANEKGMARDIIFEAIEAALAAATAKRSVRDIAARVAINRETGDYDTFRRWEVVPDLGDVDEEPDAGLNGDAAEAEVDQVAFEFPDRQIMLSDARERDPDIQLGDFIEESIESVSFGRIGAQAAKQVMMQKVREAERAQVVEAYQGRVGELVSGFVKRIERGCMYLDLGSHAEAIIPRDEMIPRETIRVGERVRGYLKSVQSEQRGPQLVVSRRAPELLIELFKLEVPEAGEGLIKILGAARDPGLRAKISVHSDESRIDPVGACVGMRGSRVQAVSNELAGERVDIIPWDEDPAKFVINAMQPAEVASIVVDEDAGSMDVAVAEDQLSQAIGRGGQNIRLASQLTGWSLNVMTESDADEKQEKEFKDIAALFVQQLDVDEEVALILAQEGFSTLEEIAYVPADEMLAIAEFEEAMVEELRNRAQDVLLTQAIVSEEKLDSNQPAADLLEMEGMDERLAYLLAAEGIKTMEDLAELAVDELTVFETVDDERAGTLIMTARAPWFADQE